MSSSQLGSIQQPVVSLDLVITENDQKRTETLELSKDELSYLITSLDSANRVSLLYSGTSDSHFVHCREVFGSWVYSGTSE